LSAKNVPVGLIGVVLARRHLLNPTGRPQPLSLRAHAAGVLALGALAFALIQGPAQGWATPRVLIAALLSATSAIAFWWLERRATTPILPRALVNDAGFRRLNLIGLCINFGAFGALFLVSLYHQQARHAGALGTGMALLPLMAMFGCGNLLSGRLMARWGNAVPLRGGLALAACASLALAAAGMQGEMPPLAVDTLFALANLGAGIAIPAMTNAMMKIGQASDTNTAAATLNANRQVGALIGVALVGAVLHSVSGWMHALPLATAMLGAAYGVAAAVAWRRSDARPLAA
jgi:DHA2 family methylenomycin A resistance protein-like MFS transporter